MRATHERRTLRRRSVSTRRLGPGMVITFAIILTVSPSASAATLTSAATDPAGDAAFSAPGFLDIVSAQVTKSGQSFSFQMSVAAPIPAVPPKTPPGNLLQWDWPLDTDPATFPPGYPFPPGATPPAEFIIQVTWDGSSFSAVLVDRRPLLNGGIAVITPLAFTISGTDVRADVGASLLGKPSSFYWGAVTFYWSGPMGSSGGNFVDALQPFYRPFPS
jgi:hypothetical protein